MANLFSTADFVAGLLSGIALAAITAVASVAYLFTEPDDDEEDPHVLR